jgi:hypothetical protein
MKNMLSAQTCYHDGFAGLRRFNQLRLLFGVWRSLLLSSHLENTAVISTCDFSDPCFIEARL